MVKRLATSPHDPLGITDSACKNQSVVVSVQYGPFNPYIPIRSTTIDSIGYPRMSASGESSTTMHRLLHASGSHPIPTPYDSILKAVAYLSCKSLVQGEQLTTSRRKQLTLEIPVARYQVARYLALYRSPEMASSLISNSHHIDFESVFRLDDASMIESCCISQLQVTCSGGTVDNQSKEATYVGDTSREVPFARCLSRGTSRKMPVVDTLALYRLPEMASSLISNSHHIDCDSVFRLDDASMVQMFETLIATGLKEFLGCPTVFYEDALTEFFANSSVREDGMVVSTMGGTAIEISQEMFVAAFELPTEGLIDLTDVPNNFVFDARSLFSDSKEQVSMSCLKKALKFHYRLLHDILEKTIYVKAGSFDSVTRDRFLLMMAITFDVKINWSSLLFGVFKEMVTPGSRQAKGYAIQICVLLRNFPGLELGESKSFPVPRILNEKTVHRFVSVNENVGIKEEENAPRARRTPVKATVSKKRPATGDDEVAPIIKKKRTTKGKPVVVKRLMVEEPDTAISTSGEPVAEDATGEREPVAEVAPGNADAAIEQVLAQLESVFKHQDAGRSEKVDTWFDEAFDEEFEIANKERQFSEEVIDVTIEEGTGERSMSRNSAVRIPTFPCTTGTFTERAEQARRHILESGQAITLEEAAERVRQADIQESDRVQRERDRARREKRQQRSSSSKRIRGF
ncbi:hypothetical protein F511_31665 [Dorcoceras hygrometricum]|uniref:Dystroglycan-like n=1 Tax=Dorcoceras hygrometricum TaxID=472368 RepID=A0A2Z7CL86_9LAMI|nr:hypothetical protein F511_31665 [Dorcoceras hygrometricum]